MQVAGFLLLVQDRDKCQDMGHARGNRIIYVKYRPLIANQENIFTAYLFEIPGA